MQDGLDVTSVCPEQQPLPQLAFIGRAGQHVVDANGEGLRMLLAQLAVQGLWHVTPPPGAWLRRGQARPPSLGAGARWTRCSRHSGEQREQRRYPHIGTGNIWMDVMIIQRHAASNSWRHTRMSARTQRRMDEERDEGRVSDVHCRIAVLHALLRVTVGAKPRYDALSLSFSRRPQHAMERGKGHICNTTPKFYQIARPTTGRMRAPHRTASASRTEYSYANYTLCISIAMARV